MAPRNIENHLSTLCLIWIRDKLPDKKSVLYHHLLCNIHLPSRIKFTIILELMIIDKLATSNNPVIYKWCWNHHLLPFMLSFNIHWMVRGASSWWSRTKFIASGTFSVLSIHRHIQGLFATKLSICVRTILYCCAFDELKRMLH